jgi:CRP-like cAMP-binding protein
MYKQTIDELLVRHSFFEGLEPHVIELIAACGSNEKFSAADYLAREGQQADKFYLIRHGTVALELHVPGQGPLTIETLQEGDILGWSWLFAPHRWQFAAKALSLVRVTAFDGVCLREKCEEDHDLGYEFMKRFAGIMIARLQATRLQLLDLYGTAS